MTGPVLLREDPIEQDESPRFRRKCRYCEGRGWVECRISDYVFPTIATSAGVCVVLFGMILGLVMRYGVGR